MCKGYWRVTAPWGCDARAQVACPAPVARVAVPAHAHHTLEQPRDREDQKHNAACSELCRPGRCTGGKKGRDKDGFYGQYDFCMFDLFMARYAFWGMFNRSSLPPIVHGTRYQTTYLPVYITHVCGNKNKPWCLLASWLNNG